MLCQSTGCSATCYFPASFQGEYVTQVASTGDGGVSYSSLSVLFDSVPAWGRCHRRIGNNVVLRDGIGEDEGCFRCFRLVLRSPNVVQAHTAASGLARCFSSEERAVAECPTDAQVRDGAAEEIMLYREYSDVKKKTLILLLRSCGKGKKVLFC